MPYKRRTNKRRTKRKSRVSRGIAPSHSGLRITRSVTKPPVIVGPGVGDVAQSWSFKLNDLPSFTEFTSLYDQYRLDKIVIRLVPSSTVTAANPSYESVNMLVLADDYDDSVLPATQAELMQRKHRFINLSSTARPYVKHTVRPKFKTADGRIATGWLDSGNNTVLHHGVKVWLHQVNETGLAVNNPAFNMEIYCTYHLSFKHIR